MLFIRRFNLKVKEKNYVNYVNELYYVLVEQLCKTYDENIATLFKINFSFHILARNKQLKIS